MDQWIGAAFLAALATVIIGVYVRAFLMYEPPGEDAPPDDRPHAGDASGWHSPE